MITAEEFFDKRSKELGFENWTNVIVNQEWDVIEKLPIELTKLHVEAALKATADMGKADWDWTTEECNSIIEDAYPLTNIK